jgi:hypothetical protein
MIPLTGDQTVEVEVTRGKKITLRYLTDRQAQVKYHSLANASRDIYFESYASVEKRLSANGAIPNPDEVKKQAGEEASRILSSDPERMINRWAEYIDIFVSGWTGESLPHFPATGSPSSVLRYYDLKEIYDAVYANLVELTGLTVEEIKN